MQTKYTLRGLVVLFCFLSFTVPSLWLGTLASASDGLASLCARHLASISSDTPDEIKSISFDTAPQEALGVVRQKYAKGARVFIELPIDDRQFSNVYERPASVTDQSEMTRVRAQIAKGLGIGSHDGLSTVTFLEAVKAVTGDVVVIVGHNYDGRFHFTKGSSEGIADLASSCLRAAKLCVFLSCNAERYIKDRSAIGLNRAIGFKDSVALAETLRSFIDASGETGVSAEEIVKKVNGMRRGGLRLFRAKLLLLGGCGEMQNRIVVAVYVYRYQSCPPNDPKCD